MRKHIDELIVTLDPAVNATFDEIAFAEAQHRLEQSLRHILAGQDREAHG
jgi:hypothetical protein